MTETMAMESLPNEILGSILSSFGTKALLPITLTSRRFYNIIVQILHSRLLNASTVKGHKLVFECSHPSSRAFTPYLFVENLGTGTCDDIHSEHKLSLNGSTDHLGKLRGLYSHFRPLLPDEVRKTHRRRHDSWGFERCNSLSEIQTDLVCQDVFLESHEYFSQLCTFTKLVKEGLKPGVFMGWVNVTGGVVRVWRDWLAEQCSSLGKSNVVTIRQDSKIIEEKEPGECLLWADPRQNTGLRIRVSKREEPLLAVLAGPNDEFCVSYMLQYEELVVRSTQLLLALELSDDHQRNSSNCGVVIGPWS